MHRTDSARARARRNRHRRYRVGSLFLAIGAIIAALAYESLGSSPSNPVTRALPSMRSPVARPSNARLDPALLDAVRRARVDAARVGVEFAVTSGWRSPERQEQLLREAVSRYGSESEAARWVATAETSAHVAGDAVDIGPTESLAWLSEHGAEYGLCQIYDNEPWHFELRRQAIGQGCPPTYPDPTYDPRMQQ